MMEIIYQLDGVDIFFAYIMLCLCIAGVGPPIILDITGRRYKEKINDIDADFETWNEETEI